MKFGDLDPVQEILKERAYSKPVYCLYASENKKRRINIDQYLHERCGVGGIDRFDLEGCLTKCPNSTFYILVGTPEKPRAGVYYIESKLVKVLAKISEEKEPKNQIYSKYEHELRIAILEVSEKYLQKIINLVNNENKDSEPEDIVDLMIQAGRKKQEIQDNKRIILI